DVLEQETDQAAPAPGALYRDHAPDPAGVAAMADALRTSRRPAIVAGDDVARRGAVPELLALAEALGAAVWVQRLPPHVPVPPTYPGYRGSLPFDAAAIRKALDGADAVLLVGGPFFEEVWFALGAPFAPGTAVLQIEEAPERLSRNFSLRAGLLASP